jgi:hypothetical protein
MTTMTRNDIINDVNMLMQNLEDINRPLVSPLNALKLSMAWPLACIAGYVVALLWMAINYVPKQDLFGHNISFWQDLNGPLIFTGGAILIAIGVGASLYNLALIYLSIDSTAREKSYVVYSTKKLIIRLGAVGILLNWSLAILGIVFEPSLINVGPLLFIFTTIVIQMVISAELTRYGIAGAMSKFARLVKKI